MITSELIKALQELDPSGNMPIDGAFFVDILPCYYDGCAREYYNDNEKTKLKLHGSSNSGKICIVDLSMDDFCERYEYNYVEVLKHVSFQSVSETNIKYYADLIKKTCEEGLKL